MCIALKYRSNKKKGKKPFLYVFFCCFVSVIIQFVIFYLFFLPITNHTGRINLQIQSSYKSKVSQKYASLLYIANVYLFFVFLFFFQSIQNLCYSTQPVLVFQHIINIFIIELHNHLENRSCVLFCLFFFPFLFIFFSFLQHNPRVLHICFSSSSPFF